jgi:hypothetical protein
MTDAACHYCNHPCDQHKEDSGCECSVAGCDCNLDKVVKSWAVVLENTLDDAEKRRSADGLVNMLYAKYSAEHDAELDRMLEREMLFGSPGLRAFAVSDSRDLLGIEKPTPKDDLPAAIAKLTDQLLVADCEEMRKPLLKHIGEHVRLWQDGSDREPAYRHAMAAYEASRARSTYRDKLAALQRDREKLEENRRDLDTYVERMKNDPLEVFNVPASIQPAAEQAIRDEFKRVGSIDICIKHRFRGTSEQPGCPECAASGERFFLDLGKASNAQVIGWFDTNVHLSQPYRTVMITGIDGNLPANDFDDTTEPSEPQKRSDEPVPAWLSSEPPEATSKTCGCTTINGITFSCLACVKGGA